ncbi:MAG TPA: hypothetical protein VEA44_00940 [Caulobacter sp.]|nr:hypothetical protein [Caulobacter sp.]
MRSLPLLLIGLSALALSACDELTPKKQASADCCCKTCPTPPAAKPASTALIEEDDVAVAEKAETSERKAIHKVKTPGHRRVARTGGGYRAERGDRAGGGYRYRTGTEGVGYLDEELAGGYRGGSYRSVEVEESERYSERYSESESGYAYGYSEGSYDSYGGRRGHKRKRHRDRGYVGIDRDGYLTWPGKTP